MATENASPSALVGRKNIYVCDACKGHIVTVDRDPGVTPFTIGCEVTLECTGRMRSSMYRVFDQEIGASHEWYCPLAVEVVSEGDRQHVKMGGLLLRRIPRGQSS